MIKVSRQTGARIDIGVNLFYGILIVFVASVNQPTLKPDVLFFWKAFILTGLVGLQTIDFNQFKDYHFPASVQKPHRILWQYLARSFVRFNLLLYLSIGLIFNYIIFKNSTEIYFDNLIGLMLTHLYVGLLSVIYFLAYEVKATDFKADNSKPQNPKFSLLVLMPFLSCLVLITPLFDFPDMNHAAILPPVFNLISHHPQPILFTFLNGGFLLLLALTAYFLLQFHLKKQP